MEVCFYCNGTGVVDQYGRIPECIACAGVGWLDRIKYEQGKETELGRIQLQIEEIKEKLALLERKQRDMSYDFKF